MADLERPCTGLVMRDHGNVDHLARRLIHLQYYQGKSGANPALPRVAKRDQDSECLALQQHAFLACCELGRGDNDRVPLLSPQLAVYVSDSHFGFFFASL